MITGALHFAQLRQAYYQANVTITLGPSNKNMSEDFEQIFCVLDSEDSPPPSTVIRIAKYVAFSRVYPRFRAIQAGRPRLGGGVFQTDDVRQVGGGPKSQFLLGRLWWMIPYVVVFVMDCLSLSRSGGLMVRRSPINRKVTSSVLGKRNCMQYIIFEILCIISHFSYNLYF